MFVSDRVHDGVFQHCIDTIAHAPAAVVFGVFEAPLVYSNEGRCPLPGQMLDVVIYTSSDGIRRRRFVDLGIREVQDFASPDHVTARRAQNMSQQSLPRGITRILGCW